MQEYEQRSIEARKRFGALKDQIAEHPRLIQAVARRDYVLFVGAGISKAMGFPLWDELVEGVRRKIGRRTKLTVIEPLQQAQILWNDYVANVYKARPINDPTQRQLAEVAFNELVIETLNDLSTPVAPPEWFQLMRGILPPDVVTTNWDSNLEQYLFDGLVNVFNFRSGRPARFHALPNLYKIHGTVEDARYVVFNEDQFQRWEQDDPYLVSKLRVLFSERPTLCLGYSFRDPNVQVQHFRAFLRFQGSTEPVYLLIDPALSPESDWGRIREQAEYFASRDVILLFGSVPEALQIISADAHTYTASRQYQLEGLKPIFETLRAWVKEAAGKLNSERIPQGITLEKGTLLAQGLTRLGNEPDLRVECGLETDSIDLPHGIGLRLLDDLLCLLSRDAIHDALEVADYEGIAQLVSRFTTLDSGAWQFDQHRARLKVVLDILPLLPDGQAKLLAPALAEHLMFAGEGFGEAWYSWDLFESRVADIPATMLKPIIAALLDEDDWAQAKARALHLLETKNDGRFGVRTKLLAQHPAFGAQMAAN